MIPLTFIAGVVIGAGVVALLMVGWALYQAFAAADGRDRWED